MMPDAPGTILRCDRGGTVREVPTDGLGITAAFPVGQPLDRLVAETDAAMARDFIAAISLQGAAFDRVLSVPLRDGGVSLHFDGVVVDGGLAITIRPMEDVSATSRSAMDAITALNNRLINRQRELARTLMERSGNPAPPPPPPVAERTIFSAREAEVVSLLVEGESNRMIAHHLGIQESAVKARLRSIFRKLGVACRAQAVKTLLAGNASE